MTEDKIKQKCKGHYRTAMVIGMNSKGRKIYDTPSIVSIKNCKWCK